MVGDWLPIKEVANPPDVNNFHDMLLVNRDLALLYGVPAPSGTGVSLSVPPNGASSDPTATRSIRLRCSTWMPVR